MGTKRSSSLGMAEADPTPGPSSGTPQDDIAGRPGAILVAMTLVQTSPIGEKGLSGYHFIRSTWSMLTDDRFL